MLLLALGLLIFIAVHSIRLVADDWRTRQIARLGLLRWKALYSLVSLLGFVLIVWGFGAARTAPLVLWQAPLFTRHLALLLTLVAFILLTAAYVPGTRIKAKLGHPMLLAVKIWALAHLLANGKAADLLLFGVFLLWSIADYAVSRRRDRLQGTIYPAKGFSRDLLALVVGGGAWLWFAYFGHAWLIGVRPF